MNYLTQHRDRHLTEEQLCELLDPPARPTSAAAALHLRTCDHCQAELTSLRASFTNLRLATTALAANPPALTQRVALIQKTSAWRLPVWTASFAALLLAVSLPFVHPGHHPAAPAAPAVAPAVETAAAADSDEALMENIQSDLATSIPPSLQPLAVPAASSAASSENPTQN